MTTDERIAALTMHLEVVTHMHEDFEKKMTEFSADVNRSIARLEEVTTELKDLANRMANIVISYDEQIEAHDERIERLEGVSEPRDFCHGLLGAIPEYTI